MEIRDLLDWWQSMRLVWAGLGVGLALAMGVVVWRVRGLLSWKRSQRRELAELRQRQEAVQGDHHRALGEVMAGCESIWRMASPDLGQIAELPLYWRRIAACYYPHEPQPELCLSIGQLLSATQQAAQGLDALLQRPGFDRLGRLRVRQIRRTLEWHRRFNDHPVVAWIMARRRMLRGILHTLRFALPDPVTWIAYLSQRLTVMMAIRCLLVDIYLFTGKVAVDTFDRQRNAPAASEDTKDAAAVLEAFESSLKGNHGHMTDELATLRNELVGIPARLLNPPSMAQWRQAVEKAARLIAAEYFPSSPAPLEEAQCRVLLNRGSYWLQAMADAHRLPVVRPIYRVSLKRLMQIKAITESDLMQYTGKVASTAWNAWRWARWPVKILRWMRRGSPAGVAVDLGFTLAGKSVLNFLARYGFDRACQELDSVYRLSCPPAGEEEKTSP